VDQAQLEQDKTDPPDFSDADGSQIQCMVRDKGHNQEYNYTQKWKSAKRIRTTRRTEIQ
jgi:hypothetical protein